MDLHGQMMNLQCVIPGTLALNEHRFYVSGFRAARHAAAELANAADAELSRLRGERQVLARLLESALPFVQDASGETQFDEDKLRAFEAKIEAALHAVSAGAPVEPG